MKRICYIGEIDFTRKNASSARVINCAKAIELNPDYKVDFIGFSNVPHLTDNGFEINNVKRGNSTVEKLYNTLTRGIQIVKLLKSLSRKDIIIYYGISANILIPLKHYCQKNKIKLIVDVVEWYDYSHLPMGRYGLKAYDVHLAITKIIPMCDGVITISSYLENYFNRYGLKNIRIPIIMDTHIVVESSKLIVFDQDYLNLIYAGFAGKKDLILNVIKSVEQLTLRGIKVKLHLLGCSKDDLLREMKCSLSENIICYGKVEQTLVSQYLLAADFSILIRPQKRYANAGFPTKFVESLSVGLPVIANLTSDLGLYLKDGYNGYVINDFTVEAITNKLKEIASLSKSQFVDLRKNAKQTAINNFDYRLFSDRINSFIENI